MDLTPDPKLHQKAAAVLRASYDALVAAEDQLKRFCTEARAGGLLQEAHDVANGAQMVELGRGAVREVLDQLEAATAA